MAGTEIAGTVRWSITNSGLEVLVELDGLVAMASGIDVGEILGSAVVGAGQLNAVKLLSVFFQRTGNYRTFASKDSYDTQSSTNPTSPTKVVPQLDET